MSLRVTIAAVFAALAFQNAYAVDSYLCIADLSAGMNYDEKLHEWRATTFKAGDKYLVKRAHASGRTWEVFHFGQKFAIAGCAEDFNSSHFLNCEGMQSFQMNSENLRFATSDIIAGYVAATANGLPEGGDSASVEIGKCSEL